MFDISFGELLVIGIVALVVIGPEKLPSVARTVGALVGRLQRYVNDVKTDIQRETSFSELRQLGSEMTDAADNLRQTIHRQMSEVEGAVNDVKSGIEAPLAEAGAAVREAGDSMTAAFDLRADAATADTVPAATATDTVSVATSDTPATDGQPAPDVDDGQLDLFATAPPPPATPPAAGDVSSKAA